MDGAVQDFTEAIRLEPNYAESYYNRSIARKAQGDYEGGFQDWARLF